MKGGVFWTASVTRSTMRDDELTVGQWSSGRREIELWWGPVVPIEDGDTIIGFKTCFGFNPEWITPAGTTPQ